MSHQIDLSSHGNALEWNGHWKYTNLLWKIIKGKRSGFVNRKPRSYHINIINNLNFNVLFEKQTNNYNGLNKNTLKRPYNNLPDEDYNCQGLYIIASK
jgi:hypothetical protein